MVKHVIYNQSRIAKWRIIIKDPIKLTALLYLKEALLKEDFESCKEIIEQAKELGAADFEIQDLLENPKRSPG